MTTEAKPLPKSLHTVTVLVRAATMYMDTIGDYRRPSAALDQAMHYLGLDEKPDTYGLKEAALKQLEG